MTISEAIINIEDPIGKTVGKRRPCDSITMSKGLQKLVREGFERSGHSLGPRGVFRFHSHEEADQWMNKMLRPKKAN